MGWKVLRQGEYWLCVFVSQFVCVLWFVFCLVYMHLFLRLMLLGEVCLIGSLFYFLIDNFRFGQYDLMLNCL